MNIHISKHTRLQPWEGKTIFGDYPVHLRPGNFTVTLLLQGVDRNRQREIRELPIAKGLKHVASAKTSVVLPPTTPTPGRESYSLARPAMCPSGRC